MKSKCQSFTRFPMINRILKRQKKFRETTIKYLCNYFIITNYVFNYKSHFSVKLHTWTIRPKPSITGGVNSNFSSYKSKIIFKHTSGSNPGHLAKAKEAAVRTEDDPYKQKTIIREIYSFLFR